MAEDKDAAQVDDLGNLTGFDLAANEMELMVNFLTSRRELIDRTLDSRRDIDVEAGYPSKIGLEQYARLYEREGIAARVVSIFPEECWKEEPKIYETEDSNETPFEERYAALRKKGETDPIAYMERLDVESGIGRFGVLLIGASKTGSDLSQPVKGVNDFGELEEGFTPPERELLFLRVFDQSLVDIKTFNNDSGSARFGKPEMYSIKFQDPTADMVDADVYEEKEVHWTRLIHTADLRRSSEVLGTPRMEKNYHRLYDLRKVLGGPGAMFWKGGYPGYAFEVNPDIADPEMDTKEMKEEFTKFQDRLQRMLAVQGVTVKSLAPQVADPTAHFETNIKAICITEGIPWRVFVGMESAQLKSGEDKKAWNGRLARRQERYLTPMIVRPLIDRLIAFGILPAPSEENGYTVEWPDLNKQTDKEKAEVLKLLVEAMARYIMSGLDQLIPPREFFLNFVELDEELVDAVLEAAEERVLELEEQYQKEREETIEDVEATAAAQRRGEGSDDEDGDDSD